MRYQTPMSTSPVRRIRGAMRWIVLGAMLCVPACDNRGPLQSVHAGLHSVSAKLVIEEAIEAENRYAAGTVEVLVGREELRVLLLDEKLAESTLQARRAVALRVVAIAERALSSDPEFPSIKAMSVAFIHPPDPLGGRWEGHVEDVFAFRRGADARFAPGG